MSVVVFLGPSLPLEEARRILPAIYLPPVGQADLISAITRFRPRVIGIVDGVFAQSLSVWHKEILFALDQGIVVYGASSMGALRAAETSEFGMIGIGKVYQQFVSGALNDDDEVALIHGNAETDYRKSSEPMVNIRATLAAARESGVIDDVTYQKIVAIAKARFYPDRTFKEIFKEAVKKGITAEHVDALTSFITAGYVDVKHDDAVLLLETIRDRPESTKENFVDYAFSDSYLFRSLYNRDRTVHHLDTDVALSSIAEHAALNHPKFHDRQFNSLNRVIALNFAETLGLTVENVAVEEERVGFLRRKEIADDELPRWLQDNDITSIEFTELMKQLATCRALHRWLMTVKWIDKNIKPFLDELRLIGEYPEYAGKTALEQHLVSVSAPMFGSLDNDSVPISSLMESHSRTTGWAADRPISKWVSDAGFRSMDEFRVALQKSTISLDYVKQLSNILGIDAPVGD